MFFTKAKIRSESDVDQLVQPLLRLGAVIHQLSKWDITLAVRVGITGSFSSTEFRHHHGRMGRRWRVVLMQKGAATRPKTTHLGLSMNWRSEVVIIHSGEESID